MRDPVSKRGVEGKAPRKQHPRLSSGSSHMCTYMHVCTQPPHVYAHTHTPKARLLMHMHRHEHTQEEGGERLGQGRGSKEFSVPSKLLTESRHVGGSG